MRFLKLYLVGYFILLSAPAWPVAVGDPRRDPGVWLAIGGLIAVGFGIMLAVASGAPAVPPANNGVTPARLARSVFVHRPPCRESSSVLVSSSLVAIAGPACREEGDIQISSPRVQRRRTGRQRRPHQRPADEKGGLDSVGPQALLRSPRVSRRIEAIQAFYQDRGFHRRACHVL